MSGLKNFLILLFLGFLFLFYAFYNIVDKESKIPTHIKLKFANKSMPLILFYTPLFNIGFTREKLIHIFESCDYRCHVTDNPNLYPHSDVAIFHSRQMYMNEFIEKHRNSNRINVYYTMESFAHEKIRKKLFPKDFFNVTATFRLDSTIARPYGKFQKIQPHEKENESLVWNENQINEILLKKSKLAVHFVSHCVTHSLREVLTEDIRRYANISSFGSCYNITNKNESEELEKHFFYLAFENSVCKDYITEKFWRIKGLIVPVVLKRSLLKGIVEDEYFIAVDDFNSTKDLVQKLKYVSTNLTEYKKYLGWTKKYKKTQSFDDRDICKFCEMAVKKEKHIIPDIFQWWETESECQFNYLNYTLQYLKRNNLLSFS